LGEKGIITAIACARACPIIMIDPKTPRIGLQYAVIDLQIVVLTNTVSSRDIAVYCLPPFDKGYLLQLAKF